MSTESVCARRDDALRADSSIFSPSYNSNSFYFYFYFLYRA